MADSLPLSVRARARAEMTAQIKLVARRHLAVDGPNLSLRAVARELGVVSSAVYRYFASRDDLLTALIIDAYNSMGEAVEQAEGAVARPDLTGRWLATGRSIREWSVANRHEYALLYGSPVPGYAAPQDTIAPASRPVVVWVGILRDGVERGSLAPRPGERLPRSVRADLGAISREPGFGGVPPAVLARGMIAWAQVFGAVSFELFGRLQNAVHDYEAYFDHQLRAMAAYIGL
jgi:AcrR family transcriptional regulator